MHDAIQGSIATGMSNGWKNIKRTVLLASMLLAKYQTYTVKVHNISSLPKTAENHLHIVKNNIDHAKKEYDVWIIAWVSDARGDSRAMQVQLHCKQPYILVFDCWAHQVNLIVGNILKLNSKLVKAGEKAIQIIQWMLHHLAKEFQASAGCSPNNLKEVEGIIGSIEDQQFWRNLDKLKAYLEPLAIAANVSQAPTTCLDHILIQLGHLYHTFRLYALNPAAFIDYYASRNEFSSDRWDYKESKEMYEQAGQPVDLMEIWSGLLAHNTPNSGRHQLAHLAIHVLSIVANSAGCKQLFSKMGYIHTKRRNRLSYEKVFDTAVVRMNLKRQHAALGLTRARLQREFGISTSHPDQAASLPQGTRDAAKNEHDETGEEVAEVDMIDDNQTAYGMRTLAATLHQDTIDDEDPHGEGEEPADEPLAVANEQQTHQKKIRLFFGTQYPIRLQDLFDYSTSTPKGQGLDYFMQSGLANLQKELEIYDLATRDMFKSILYATPQS